ncbi:MAG: ABC transporter ATP-binding protein [Caldilineaceae bacterium SB0665_bin_21]|nr:ABC transporter ATP-binding protein [Caldilineaceae bacterium SB0665_bin_21]MYA05237.1 ABC transporter ATP-binding protein [Caldilineaceae bacterium SB0664_bin_22]MYC61561.1 ABC transporter ATP-binding protein [Caldilineaceae bacterium SB0661_bin_34]
MSRATRSFELAAQVDETDSRSLRETAWRVMRLVLGYRLNSVIVMATMALASGAIAFGPFMIGWTIDNRILIEAPTVQGLYLPLAILLVNYGLQYLGFRWQFYTMGLLTGKLMTKLRADIFVRIQSLSLSYFDKNDAGDLMSKLVNDVDVLNQFLSQGLTQLIGGLVRMLLLLGAMAVLDWRMALISLCAVPLILLVSTRLAAMARVAYRRSRQSLGAVSTELEEGIAGVKVAQAFNRVEANQRHFDRLNRDNLEANVGAVSISAAFAPAIESLNALTTAAVIGLGGWLVLEGRLTLGVLISFLEYIRRFFFPLQEISQQWNVLQGALAGAERTFELLDQQPDLEDTPDAVELPAVGGEVEFDGVTFGYDPDEPVLRDVSFRVGAGQTCAVVGPTGAGKTSLINLLARFYDVQSGSVRVDGIDVRDVTQDSLRRQIGVVLQENFMFSDTVQENIRYGRLEATDAEVAEAAQLVEAEPFIFELEDGYLTELGERGGTLSQGQRQLLSFARALVADPRILVLDEATASVDTRTEVVIQNVMQRMLRNRTSIVIAHRLSTIRNADMVLVMDHGRIVERGTHDELMVLGGLYADLHTRQFSDVVSPNGVPPAEPATAA